MAFIVMGTSYKTAPISTREKIAVATSEQVHVLQELCRQDGIKEAALLSTCNRVELFLNAYTDRIGADAARAFFAERLGDKPSRREFYLYRDIDAVQHVFRVVCSLDSQVLGEAQILGQMKRSYETAVEAQTCHDIMTKLYKLALNLGKRVRSETGIGADSVSLSTTAFKAASMNIEDFSSSSVVVLGAGEMAELISHYLVEARAADIVVVSRTIAHAERFAETIGARAVAFEDRYDALARADVVFSMMGSEDPIVAKDELARARSAVGRSTAPLVIVDEGVPRNVEAGCDELFGVVLYDQEALADIIDEGRAHRAQAVAEVERMADEAVEEFLTWMQERLVSPTVKEIYSKGDLVVARELKHAQKELRKACGGELCEGAADVLEAYGNAIVKKLLHGPVMRLRKEAKSADSFYYTEAARYLFGLDTFPPGTRRIPTEVANIMGTGKLPKNLDDLPDEVAQLLAAHGYSGTVDSIPNELLEQLKETFFAEGRSTQDTKGQR